MEGGGEGETDAKDWRAEFMIDSGLKPDIFITQQIPVEDIIALTKF